jgi:hypothetical protein
MAAVTFLSSVFCIADTKMAYLSVRHFHLTVAERTGLEPATPGVTGRYSNQLNYRSGMVGGAGIEPATLAL